MHQLLIKTAKMLGISVGALFIVYFWNMDQKLMGWAYNQINAMFDRKPVDINF